MFHNAFRILKGAPELRKADTGLLTGYLSFHSQVVVVFIEKKCFAIISGD